MRVSRERRATSITNYRRDVTKLQETHTYRQSKGKLQIVDRISNAISQLVTPSICHRPREREIDREDAPENTYKA